MKPWNKKKKLKEAKKAGIALSIYQSIYLYNYLSCHIFSSYSLSLSLTLPSFLSLCQYRSLSLPLSLCICLSLFLSLSPSFCDSVCLSFSLSLSLSPSLYDSVCLYLSLTLYLSFSLSPPPLPRPASLSAGTTAVFVTRRGDNTIKNGRYQIVSIVIKAAGENFSFRLSSPTALGFSICTRPQKLQLFNW